MLCGSCGLEIPDGLRFCTGCGLRIVDDGVDVRPAETASELLEGTALRRIIDEQAPMFWRRAFELLETLCVTLAENHVEQTLAPEQIYVDQRPGQPRRIKLAPVAIRTMRGDDRGDTAVGYQPNLAKYGIAATFPPQMAPETLMGKPFVPATHVYNLGVIAYEMLVGQLPFPHARGPAGLITAQLKHRPQAPSQLRSDIPPEVDAVVQRCLLKTPAERFANVTVLAATLGGVLNPERPRALDARYRELEAAINEAPYDHSAYAVYADWLLQQGDPRGELIALQLRLEIEVTDRTSKLADELRGLASAQFAKHTGYLLGPLRAHVGNVPDAPTPFGWRYGFIHDVVLDSDTCAVHEVLEQLFRHPSGRFVTDLDLALDHAEHTAAVITTIVRHAPATLRGLAIQSERPLGDLAPLWPAMPRLRRLTITAPTFELGSLQIPDATHVKIRAGRLSRTAARSIASAPWPQLELLQIRFGLSTVSHTDLAPLLDRDNLPALSKLGLLAWRSAGLLCARLRAHPLMRRILNLDLSFGNLHGISRGTLAKQLVELPDLQLVVSAGSLVDDGSEPLHVVRENRLPDELAYLD